MLLVLSFAAGACRPSAGPGSAPVAFDTARAWVHAKGDSVPLLVEVARTEAQRARGLQQRETLDEGSGMVFLFDSIQGPEEGFWMWRTLVPLDLAYLDARGRVVAVRSMEPCESPVPEWCREASLPYRPGVPYASALEVNRGWLERHGVGVGARVVLEPDTAASPAP